MIICSFFTYTTYILRFKMDFRIKQDSCVSVFCKVSPGFDTTYHSHTGESDSALHDIVVPNPFSFPDSTETQVQGRF